jgi:hypothetical protein
MYLIFGFFVLLFDISWILFARKSFLQNIVLCFCERVSKALAWVGLAGEWLCQHRVFDGISIGAGCASAPALTCSAS